MTRAALTALSFVVMMSAGSGVATAGPISWVNWLPDPNLASGLALGTLPGGVTVGYSGDLQPPTQTADGAGINYWNPASPYLSSTVSNAPPCCEIITLQAVGLAGTNTLAFSSPVLDPVMAIVSLGRPGFPVSYDFDTAFTLLSSGFGYWNVVTGQPGSLTGGFPAADPTVLVGIEGHGVIQFRGSVSQIQWTSSPSEFWHGFQIGVSVPDPASSLFLFSTALGLLAMARRRAK